MGQGRGGRFLSFHSLPFWLLSSPFPPPEMPDTQATCMYSQYPAILTSCLVDNDLYAQYYSFITDYLVRSAVIGIVF